MSNNSTCNATTNEPFSPLNEGHPVLGSLYIAHGTIYLIPYIPCMIVMVQNKLYKMPCYKIMIFMGVLDVLNLFSAAFLAGYYSIIGRSYREGDRFMPTVGATALGMWAAYCACCILLAFNRCVDLRSQHWSEKMFGGKRALLWLLIPIFYGGFFASPAQPKVVYSADIGVWFIDGDPICHTVNNIVTCAALIGLYICLVVLLWKKTRGANSESVSAMQKQVIVQSCLICLLDMLACISYIIIQAAKTSLPLEVYKVSQFMWQACHGGNTVIYLTMNRTIRKGVLRLIRGKPVNSVNVAANDQMQNPGNSLSSKNRLLTERDENQRRGTISDRRATLSTNHQ
uniref:G-protein coupled receptors family 1 profile domain-containing protein n=1 Tax=Plectus sambesii TaxID=2011161 RepID=A0A914XA65_9BILA